KPEPPKIVTRVSSFVCAVMRHANTGWSPRCIVVQGPRHDPESRGRRALTSRKAAPYLSRHAQVAELVDALVSGTSGESRGGSSHLLGTMIVVRIITAIVLLSGRP